MLPLLRCSRDAGKLDLAGDLRCGVVGIIEARLQCSTCKTEYRIQDGIVRLMKGALTPEVQNEMTIIDASHAEIKPGPFLPPDLGWRSELSDLLEIPPHLKELKPLDGCRVLEFGCGDGRFTILMAQLGARILAVDLSINALKKLAWWQSSGVAPTTYQPVRLPSDVDLHGKIGLIQADASNFHVAQRNFDRALSATPLDSREERMRMYCTIADALTDEGRFVGGVEHDDLIRRLLGFPLARRYSKGGTFIEHFDNATLRREVAPFFSKLSIRPIRPAVPFIRRLPLAWALWILRTIGVLPVLRQVGQILLFRAERPVRPPVEDARRPGSMLVKGLFSIFRHTKLDRFF
jgi:SAM-dependent methyltransferase